MQTETTTESTITTCLSKVRHDLEQLQYLSERELIPTQYKQLIPAYQGAVQWMRENNGLMQELSPELSEAIRPFHNQLIHKFEPPVITEPLLNQDVDLAKLESQLAETGIAVCDQFLSEAALKNLLRFCQESTFWNDARGLFLGAYAKYGFSCNLLDGIGREMRHSMPQNLTGQQIKLAWAYKYDSALPGIPPHADPASINVNLWITPDSANLNPERGGMVIYNTEAPEDWEWVDYNRNTTKIIKFLNEKKARATIIPHKQNRAVFFNSRRFHATDEFSFAPGYENRRINITFLWNRPNH